MRGSTQLQQLVSLLMIAGASVMAACGTPEVHSGGGGASGGNGGGNGGTGAGGSGVGGFSIPNVDAGGNDRGTGGSNPNFPPPSDFTTTESGGYKLGDPLTAANSTVGGDATGGCNILVGVVRDFKSGKEVGGHPDFEMFEANNVTKNLVGPLLGSDKKPIYASQCEAGTTDRVACPFGQQTTSADRFNEWYHNTDGVNQPFLVYFLFSKGATGVSTFDSSHFFPLDGKGFGNSGQDDKKVSRNFHFTTELHMNFKYGGGETFTFSGDDDLWVFVNGKLALDLGGLHPKVDGTITLDAAAATLGISKGNVYPLELFHAERHTVASNFRVDTNFNFVDCGRVID